MFRLIPGNLRQIETVEFSNEISFEKHLNFNSRYVKFDQVWLFLHG